MSTEITLYPKNGSREKLRKILLGLGFKRTSHLWKWPPGSLHYAWFDTTDFRSFDGVEASIYLPSEDEKKKYGYCEWALHTRTRASASPADKEMQNLTIREGRKQCDGNFYNDSYGVNRYTQVEADNRDPASRGIYLSYEFAQLNIKAVRYALPKPNEGFEKMVGTDLEPLSTADPARVLYNALIPFAVAVVEYFFSQSFKILLHYEPRARDRLRQQNRKIEAADVLAIERGDKTLEDVIANWYSFQNIASINNAFSEWIGLDFWKLLRQRKKIGRQVQFLEKRLNELIEFRHGVVHRLSLDIELKRPQIQEMLDLVLVLMEVFVDHLEKDLGKVIRHRTSLRTAARKRRTRPAH